MLLGNSCIELRLEGSRVISGLSGSSRPKRGGRPTFLRKDKSVGEYTLSISHTGDPEENKTGCSVTHGHQGETMNHYTVRIEAGWEILIR